MNYELIGKALIAAGKVLVSESAEDVPVEAEVVEETPKETKTAKKKTTRKKKAAKKKPEPVEEVSDDEFDEPQSDESPEITEDVLRKLCVQKAKEKSKEFVYDILGKHGAEKLNLLDSSKYQVVFDELSA